jgi:predicted lipopolysaccharide heptosyltransferase III
VRILLVRLRLIGDVVFTTPIIRALRRRYPDAHLTYVVEPAAAPVVRGNPHITELIVARKRHGVGRVRDDLTLARQLRRGRFDLAIDLHGGPRSAFLVWASGARRRIGYAIKGRSWMYTDVVPRAADLAPRHSVLSQWDLLAPLGIEAGDPGRDAVEMAADPQSAARVDSRLRRAGIPPDAPLVVIHLSAGNPFRRWPEDSFARIVSGLADADPSRRIILTAGPSDATAVQRVVETVRAHLRTPESVPMVEDWDLAELRALIDRAAVYIGGDSGPLHVAATTETPIVELLGPTLPERSRPWRHPRLRAELVDVGALPCRPCDQRRCAPGDFRCLTGITPERVIAAAEKIMKGSGVMFSDSTRK